MWLPLGDGWSKSKVDGKIYFNNGGITMSYDDHFFKFYDGRCWIAELDEDYCTLEIVQKLIENIKELEK